MRVAIEAPQKKESSSNSTMGLGAYPALAHPILDLQRRFGNQAVLCMLQTKRLTGVQQSGGAQVVHRAVSYPPARVTTEDPILRVLRNESALALTTLTVNGTALPPDTDAATTMIKHAFRPTEVEPKNVPTPPARGSSSGRGLGSGSGSGSSGRTAEGSGSGSGGSGSASPTVQWGFKDFDVKISATMILPTAPSHGQWGPTYLRGSDLGGSAPAVCAHKTRIEVVMKGKPDTDTFYEKVKANEQEHVDDFKSASDRYLVPYYRAILALRGTGQDSDAGTVNLQSQLERLPDDSIRSFLSKVLADIRRRDVPGGHPTQERTRVLDPDCDRMEIIGEPKPAPRAGGGP